MTENVEQKIVETKIGNEAIPAKFLDPKTGEVRVDTILKSYKALEKKLSEMKEGDLLKKINVPESAEEYDIQINHDFFAIDPEVNQKLLEKGFSLEQAQLVYDMAAEKLIPMVVELSEEFEAEREIERLEEFFGGEERLSEVSRQILAWGQKNLSAQVLENMSTSFDGVIALYKMMQNDEPKAIKESATSGIDSEKELQSMMKDPRYWRDRDPAYIEKVTKAFQNFYKEV